jgi:hypothetical protein
MDIDVYLLVRPIDTRRRTMRSTWVAAAREGGLGEARQLHRALSASTERAVGWILGGTTIVGLFLATRSDWLALVIVLAAGAVVATSFVNLVDLPSPRRIVVCDGGLLLDDPGRGRQVVAWDDIRSAGPVVRAGPTLVFELAVRRGTGEETIELGPYTGRSALTRSILTRHPVPVSPWPRVVAAVVVVGLVGLAVWQVVLPRFVVRQESTLPSSSDDYGDACGSPGTAYTRAPAYAGPPPHPLLVAPPGVRWRLDQEGTSWYVKDPASVQLIACVDRDGDDGSTGELCSYSTSNVGIGGRTETQTLRAGWYTITVYELRTHRTVGSSRILGDNHTCPQTKLEDDEVYSTPSDSQLHEALDPYTQRAA